MECEGNGTNNLKNRESIRSEQEASQTGEKLNLYCVNCKERTDHRRLQLSSLKAVFLNQFVLKEVSSVHSICRCHRCTSALQQHETVKLPCGHVYNTYNKSLYCQSCLLVVENEKSVACEVCVDQKNCPKVPSNAVPVSLMSSNQPASEQSSEKPLRISTILIELSYFMIKYLENSITGVNDAAETSRTWKR